MGRRFSCRYKFDWVKGELGAGAVQQAVTCMRRLILFSVSSMRGARDKGGQRSPPITPFAHWSRARVCGFITVLNNF
jgi:hypothetical protein